MSSIIKRIPIAIGIKPNQVTTFTNKTIDGTQNTLQNIPTGALQYSTISINGNAIPLGGNINLQVEGGTPIVNTDTTYSIKASTISGGARFDLDAGGSGTGTDSIEFLGGGSVTVTRSNDNTIVISDAGGGLAGNFITATSTDTLLNKDIDGNNNTISNIANDSLVNSGITINDTLVQLGGSITVAGGGGGGDVTGSSVTTFTNKTISGINNTLLSIDKSSIKQEHRYISINGTQVELGTNFNVSGLGDVTTTGEQDLSNKSLLAPVISDGIILGTLNAGGAGNSGSSGQILVSNGSSNAPTWQNANRTTETDLTFGAGIASSSGNTFNGSNGTTISVDTSTIATLAGTQTLQNKTLESPTLSDSTYDVTLPTLAANDQLVTEDATQTLTNKTLDAVNLTGDLKVDGASGATGQVIVSDGAGGLSWGAGGGGGGSGDVTGPANALDESVARYDSTTGKVLQNSLVTISDTGAITAPAASSIIPFLYSTQADFPSATTYHGAIAHSHADGAMFFAHSGNWVQMANAADVQVSSRTTHSANTGNLSNNATAYPDITGGYKSYLLFKVNVSHGAWVRVYTSKAARSADSSRNIDTDPQPGSGVLAEVITSTTNQTQVLSPGVIGFNDESTPVGEFYLAVTNLSGSSQSITVTLTALKLEA